MKASLDKGRFGPWALVTGASSGIGKEFTRQIAASGINVVLVARRDALLAELGRAVSQEFGVQYRVLAMDLSQEGLVERRYEMGPLGESSIPGCKRQGRGDFRPWVYFRSVLNSEEGL